MRVLVACEESQAVCIEFRKLGHEAYSCDLMECSGGHPEWHIQGDVLPLLKQEWDMIIAFPPCTHLAVSGAAWFEKKRADGRQQEGIDFFMKFTDLKCPKVAIENPIGIMSGIYKEPTQIIQPYYFGERARKSTCLWLKGLRPLEPTDITDHGEVDKNGHSFGASSVYARDESGRILAWNNPMTAKIRSKTFSGVAKAMATQWGDPNYKPKQIEIFELLEGV